jgi:hypothetical protein
MVRVKVNVSSVYQTPTHERRWKSADRRCTEKALGEDSGGEEESRLILMNNKAPILIKVWGLFVFRGVGVYGLGFLEANCLDILVSEIDWTINMR